MNPNVSRLLELIPERAPRAQSGTRFNPASSTIRHPERLALLAATLGWLTPLATLSVDDQRVLGLVNAAGRPVHAADLEEGADGEEGTAAEAQPAESIQHVAA